MALTSAYKQQLKAIGHRLSPIITIADNGLTDNIGREIERALDNHEVIKIRISIADRDMRREVAEKIAMQHSAELIQRIGSTALLFRPASKPSPRLSNLLRSL